VAIVGYRKGGFLVSEVGVPASASIQSGRIYVDAGGAVNTGIAIANPRNQDAAVSFYFTDASGNNFGHGSFILDANSQMAAFVNEVPFHGPPSLQGTLTLMSSVPISLIALRGITNERGEFLITALPVTAIEGALGNGTLVLPHFANGGGWSTEIVLTNPTDLSLAGTIQFFGQGSASQGALPLTMTVQGIAGSTFSYSLPARGAVRMRTESSEPAVQVGSVRITPLSASNVPSVQAILTFRDKGITVTSAGVPATVPGTAFQIYAESAGGFGQPSSIRTGLAIANGSTSSVAVHLEVTKLDGTDTGLSTSLNIPAGGQIARFTNELFPALPAAFQGILRIAAPAPVVVTGLRSRYNERGDFLVTTTPPWNEAVVPTGSETVFPHIVHGAGYSTQFIVWGSSSGQPATGNLWYMSDGGTLQTGDSLISP
jgi:hypothetical protein